MRGPASSDRKKKTDRMNTNFNNPESTAESPRKPATAVARAIIKAIKAQRIIRPPEFESAYSSRLTSLSINRTNTTDGDRLVDAPIFCLTGTLDRPGFVLSGSVPVLPFACLLY